MVNNITAKLVGLPIRCVAAVSLVVLSFAISACGGDGNTGQLQVGIYGWGPSGQGGNGFNVGVPSYEGATVASVSLTKPLAGQRMTNIQTQLSNGKASLSSLATGKNLRLDFTVFTSQSEPKAAGSTPIFNYGDQKRKNFSVMVTPVNTFAPVGHLAISDGGTQVNRSRFDASEVSSNSLTLAGHRTASFDNGNKVLVLGGASLQEARTPGSLPPMTGSYDGIQIFDLSTARFQSLNSYEAQSSSDQSGSGGNGGQGQPPPEDTFSEGIAYSTLTKVGDKRFIAAGGVALRADQARAVDDVYLIDLLAQPGNRIQTLRTQSGSQLSLNDERVFHTATYQPSTNSIVIAGGLARGGQSDVLASVEVLKLGAKTINEAGTLSTPRAEHEALRLPSGQIAVMGGHNGSSALASTEKIKIGSNGQLTSANAGATMNQARYNFESLLIGTSDGQRIVVLGGFGALSGEPLATFEIGRPADLRWFAQSGWSMNTPRGGLAVERLRQTGDILVFGGTTGSGAGTGGERLTFKGISGQPPFSSQAFEGSSTDSRTQARTTLLSNGKVLLTGGVSSSDSQTLGTAEFFTPFDPVDGHPTK